MFNIKKSITTLLILFLLFCVGANHPDIANARSYRTKSSDVYVKGYYKKNGTYVKPYYRSKSDSSVYNNYSCIDYGKCGNGGSSYSTTTTNYKPIISTSSSIKVKTASFITLDSIKTLYRETNNAYYVTGKTSNNCSKIEVKAFNFEKDIYDDYFLKTYSYGDTTFKYGIREDWNNLAYGTNYYKFIAHCDDGNKEAVKLLTY